MKRQSLKLVTILALTLFAASAFADKGFGYHGQRGYYNDHRAHRNRHGDDSDYQHHQYAPNNYHYKHVYEHCEPDGYYQSDPGYDDNSHLGYQNGDISYIPIVAGSLIGGVIGAEIGGSDPAALGGALLGASIGRDIAYRRAYRH